MTLETLAQALRAQATSTNSITLNADVLPQAEADAVSAAFLLGAGQYLTVSGVTAADIPDPQGSALQVSAGSVSLFKQSNITPHITFTADEQGAVQCVVAAGMPAGWGFASSFPDLVVFPFDDLSPSETYFVYASQPQDAFYPWADKPTEGIALAAGLNFASWMTLDIFSGAVAVLEEVLSVTTAYKFSGPFSADESNPYPVTTLTLKLSDATFEITDQLSVGDLSLIVEITEPVDSVQNISLSLAAFTTDLEFSVGISGSDPSLVFTAAPIAGHQFTAAQILTLPGGSDFQTFIPDELSDAFKEVGLDYFTITLAEGKAVGFVGFSISTVSGFTWGLIPDVLTLENITMELSYSDPFGPAKLATVYLGAECKLFPSIFPDMFDFVLELDNAGAGNKWEVGVISGEYKGSVTLSALVAAVVGNTSNVPDVLSDISFANFGADATKVGDGYTYTLHGRADAAFPMLDTELISSLSVVADYSKTGYDVDLKGALGIGAENFALELKLSETSGGQAGQPPAGAGTSSIVLHASWAVTGTQYLQFEDIADAFGFSDMPPIPEGLDLSLKQANLTYHFTEKELGIGLQSANYGNADFVSLMVGTASEYFFGLGVDHPLNLSNLPLLDDVLGPDETVEITNLRVVISSATIKSGDAATIKAVTDLINSLGTGYPNIPSDGIASGVSLSMVFSAGQWQTPLSISTGGSSGGTGGGQTGGGGGGTTTAPATTGGNPPPTQSSDGTTWFNLQKTFGPVAFQKVGIRYEDSTLYFLMNASLSAGGLTISVMGLGVGSPLTTFDLHFTINGLAITFQEGPVEVSGAMVGTLDPLNFYGELVLGFPEFKISALGGYAEYEGHPSFFLYAVLDYPIGGPSFFFVTGLAAGFGFNRKLLIPDVSGVATFPLVAWATGSGNPPGMNPGGDIGQQVTQVLTTLSTSGVVAPSVGDYWLALGINFTSFELVNSFALLTVTFGTKFEVDLLGLSTLSIPPEVSTPVAQAQLELKASFSPDTGLLAIAGQLTRQSYVLSQQCHLTGGFAFYSWFSGDNAGDFVVTLGGYSPRFTPPPYYPAVPRLGMNWQVTDELTIQGDLYFALTSTAVMAGGGMSAVWKSGDISAWFSVQADFLLVFLPFHYYLSASIQLGASFKLDLLFTSVTMTIHLGVSLEIWGPDFTGEATVDLSIISFTISFGASGQQTNTTIPWSQFVGQLLPSGNGQKTSTPDAKMTAAGPGLEATADAAATDPPPPVVQIAVSNGLLKTLSDKDGDLNYVVSGEKFEMTVQSAIPIKDFTFSSNFAPVSGPTTNTDFGVGPVGTAPADFTSAYQVSITSDENSTFQAVPVLANVPKALWEVKSFDQNGVPQNVDPLNNTTIPNALIGFKLIPSPPEPRHTLPIQLVNLQYTIDPNIQHFVWSDPYYPTADSFSAETVTSTIAGPLAEANRPQLLTAMQNAGLPVLGESAVNVGDLADQTTNYLLAPPVLSLLGEQKTSSTGA